MRDTILTLGSSHKGPSSGAAVLLEMLPKLGVYAQSVQKLRGPKNKPKRFQRAWCDSNARLLASEANTLSS